MPPAHNPCNISVSSTGSDSCRKSSQLLTMVLLAAGRSNLSESQVHLSLVLSASCPFTPSRWQRPTRRHHLVLHPTRSCCWSSTAYQGPAHLRGQTSPPYFQCRRIGSIRLAPLLLGSPHSFSQSCAIITHLLLFCNLILLREP